ncbi:hypothetical protein NW77_131 [Erwinia phage phiEa2809]|uniref:Uncharacterized protein n=1 Tax=Erwinia phage phiEa2809 TaxID=1564096 RepID=A0A0A0YSD8_9CAUD|nr:hypothetical protein NW77_131 [Erwinia phage phiEa2809]AIX13139.1 hypothetical protein NW77_131 [Erwinia phage phiEa2809]
MRNVQQWRRKSDQRVLRVFKSGGIKKTLEKFLQDIYKVTNTTRRFSGQIVHTDDNQYHITKGDYLVVDWTTKSLTLFSNEAQMFKYMLDNNFGFEGVERVNNMQISNEIDNTALITRWGNWAYSGEKASTVKRVEVEGGGNAVLPDTQKIQTIAVDGTATTHMITAAQAKNVPVGESENTRTVPAEPRSGEPVMTNTWVNTSVKPGVKKKTFAQRLLGFLSVFRR